MVDRPSGTTTAELVAERESEVAAPPALAWAIAGDSNRWDRVVRAGPSAYTTESVEGEEGKLMVGHGQLAGMPASWLERGEWMEDEFLVGERRYLSGPLAVAGFRLDVKPHGRGSHVRLRAYMTPAQPLPEAFAAALLRNMERAAERYLGALKELFRGADLPLQQEHEPAASFARRALLTMTPSELLDGGTAALHEEHLSYCAERLAAAPIDPDHRERILGYLRSRADADLEQIRPFELAQAWKVKRRPLLRSFLHAASAGLFDLHWQVSCPRCRVGAGTSAQLAALAPRAHCDMCDIEFDLDFAANVEAVFRVNPAIREVGDRVYCISSPWFRPHVFAVVELEAGESRRLALPRAAARGFVARTLTAGGYTLVEPGPRRICLDRAGIQLEPLEDAADAAALELVNRTERACAILLERPEASAYSTRGTDILTMPEFLDLYSTEAPASTAEIAIGSVSVLFSDLTNTTELYRSLGDARAFSLVREHFEDMETIVDQAGGAILKTMGDAVMASFASPGDAVTAALRMIESTRRRHAGQSFHLKVGVHNGPCVMVRANGVLDLFGTTVNVAWRLQEQARDDQLVMVASLLDHPEVARVLSAHALTADRTEARLKGLGEGHALAVITLPLG